MARAYTCDICHKPTKRIVAKLYMVPVSNGHQGDTPNERRKARAADHSKYSAHADIGECCWRNAMSMVKWTKRNRRERERAGSTLAAGDTEA